MVNSRRRPIASSAASSSAPSSCSHSRRSPPRGAATRRRAGPATSPSTTPAPRRPASSPSRRPRGPGSSGSTTFSTSTAGSTPASPATRGSRLAAIYPARFRPEFVPAFRAWVAQRPFTNRHAVPGPLYMPQYRSADLARSATLDTAADDLYRSGTAAKAADDKYILSTVFFAAVLLFAGISLRLDWRPLRMAVLGMALALLIGGGAFVLTLPVA